MVTSISDLTKDSAGKIITLPFLLLTYEEIERRTVISVTDFTLIGDDMTMCISPQNSSNGSFFHVGRRGYVEPSCVLPIFGFSLSDRETLKHLFKACYKRDIDLEPLFEDFSTRELGDEVVYEKNGFSRRDFKKDYYFLTCSFRFKNGKYGAEGLLRNLVFYTLPQVAKQLDLFGGLIQRMKNRVAPYPEDLQWVDDKRNPFKKIYYCDRTSKVPIQNNVKEERSIQTDLKEENSIQNRLKQERPSPKQPMRELPQKQLKREPQESDVEELHDTVPIHHPQVIQAPVNSAFLRDSQFTSNSHTSILLQKSEFSELFLGVQTNDSIKECAEYSYYYLLSGHSTTNKNMIVFRNGQYHLFMPRLLFSVDNKEVYVEFPNKASLCQFLGLNLDKNIETQVHAAKEALVALELKRGSVLTIAVEVREIENKMGFRKIARFYSDKRTLRQLLE